ncbi:hypothetical protein F5148DRAFT_290043 [Russula earlei]|uniref:Uncharacterized protein n=1 Tax=Russula earlei TaxID=71964 RepID=A0ACC0UP84_9AGAM|nr:hypothetical protein F5148DRAFT_290043 [Russula earlei]
MVPVEDMEPFEGFRPFTELDPGPLSDPVTIREPNRDLRLARPPFEFVWNPSVVVPAVGGMRVRVGRFVRRGPAGEAAPSTARENETDSASSGSEGYFTARDWTSSPTPDHHPCEDGESRLDTFLLAATPTLMPHHPTRAEFIQGSSRSTLPLPQRPLAGRPGDAYPPSLGNALPQFEALAQHYAAVQDREKGGVATPSPCHAAESTPTFASCPQRKSFNVTPPPQDCSTDTPTAPQPLQTQRSHAQAKAPRRSSMPGTLLGVASTSTSTESDRSESAQPQQQPQQPSMPDRGETEAAVDEVEDWATREPWEYVHRVLTTSTCPLVMLLKAPTGDMSSAALGALGADLRLQTMLIDNEHWLLVGPRDADLYEFGARFQARAAAPHKFVFRFGNLNWGADVNQIEDEVFKEAAVESSARRGGRGTVPAALPAQFMAGAVGGFVVWYALSLM